MAELDPADAPGQDELDLAGRDLFIELHGRQEPMALGGGESDLCGEASALKQPADALDFTTTQAQEVGREFGGGDLAG